jgi:hypothetical protein
MVALELSVVPVIQKKKINMMFIISEMLKAIIGKGQ